MKHYTFEAVGTALIEEEMEVMSDDDENLGHTGSGGRVSVDYDYYECLDCGERFDTPEKCVEHSQNP